MKPSHPAHLSRVPGKAVLQIFLETL